MFYVFNNLYMCIKKIKNTFTILSSRIYSLFKKKKISLKIKIILYLIFNIVFFLYLLWPISDIWMQDEHTITLWMSIYGITIAILVHFSFRNLYKLILLASKIEEKFYTIYVGWKNIYFIFLYLYCSIFSNRLKVFKMY